MADPRERRMARQKIPQSLVDGSVKLVYKGGNKRRPHMSKTVEVNVFKLDNGLYVLTFDGAMRGDAAKFDHRDARIAAAAWDGKKNGDWVNGEWAEFTYICPWGILGSSRA